MQKKNIFKINKSYTKLDTGGRPDNFLRIEKKKLRSETKNERAAYVRVLEICIVVKQTASL